MTLPIVAATPVVLGSEETSTRLLAVTPMDPPTPTEIPMALPTLAVIPTDLQTLTVIPTAPLIPAETTSRPRMTTTVPATLVTLATDQATPMNSATTTSLLENTFAMTT